ncbi:MAG: peptide chain release factor N(5)-glutamine methyltransferase [Candidatus Omnitrophica bacterium]|nr:peptide chain release factor N(5)-glutamine methyltransferase [Candidatus Omnitrophota bacterium]
MTFHLIESAEKILSGAGVHNSRWTAEQLLSRRLGCRPVELYLKAPLPEEEKIFSFRADVAARAGGIPLQYLLGSAGFYGRDFLVGPGVFIPRPETEALAEAALELMREIPHPVAVDVGTGSGAIAVTLALECPGARVLGIEKSSPALSFARANAARHRCGVSLIQGDLLGPLPEKRVDLIAANLPYLDPAEASRWPRELHWEPWLAQDGGEGGLSLIYTLLGQAASLLKPEGRVLLEIGQDQAGPIGARAGLEGFQVERVAPDLSGTDRVMVLRRGFRQRKRNHFALLRRKGDRP